ncbi:MAG: hypothetical protein RIS36_1782 [Pseudomonadota bacterium]|jgi:hypothetical protein
MPQVSKLQSIKSHLVTAVRLLFEDGDPCAIHTLVGAASIVSFDLMQSRFPGKAWEHHVLSSNEMTMKDYLQMARKAQNFLKHADREGDGNPLLELKPEETEGLLWVSFQNYRKLIAGATKIPPELLVFELWYIAKHCTAFNAASDKTARMLREVQRVFPNLNKSSRSAQAREGRRQLKRVLQKNS